MEPEDFVRGFQTRRSGAFPRANLELARLKARVAELEEACADLQEAHSAALLRIDELATRVLQLEATQRAPLLEQKLRAQFKHGMQWRQMVAIVILELCHKRSNFKLAEVEQYGKLMDLHKAGRNQTPNRTIQRCLQELRDRSVLQHFDRSTPQTGSYKVVDMALLRCEAGR